MDGGPCKILSFTKDRLGHLPQLLIGYMKLLSVALIYVTYHNVKSGCVNVLLSQHPGEATLEVHSRKFTCYSYYTMFDVKDAILLWQ